ncbi:Pycsar system effector family protein [Streptomyces platensis]|uniref:Pycsar system effector family protein n=1 Tax=Streptomyces platensis TaxID=58346 RepID=UPI0036AB425D
MDPVIRSSDGPVATTDDGRLDDGQRLDAALTQVLAEIARTDTKASTLLAAFALPLAVLVAAVPGHSLPRAAAALTGLGAVGLVGAMLIVLLVVRPRITGTPRGSYLYWATCTPDEVLADLRKENRAEHIARLSRIAHAKYRALRTAIDVTAGALVALVAALLVVL